MQIAQRLREVREDRKIEITQIAKALNITEQNYIKYENGIRLPSPNHLIAICKYYNISANYFLGLIDEPEPLK